MNQDVKLVDEEGNTFRNDKHDLVAINTKSFTSQIIIFYHFNTSFRNHRCAESNVIIKLMFSISCLRSHIFCNYFTSSRCIISIEN